MIRLLLLLALLLSNTGMVLANQIDAQIDKYVSPVSDKVSKFVFSSISIGGAEMPYIVLWMIIGAVVFTIYTRFIGVWGFKHSLELLAKSFKKSEEASGEVSPFQALATALSGTIGLGNIAGVAIAISLGGPGAMFWMVVGATLGMASKFVEATLGVKYRIINEDGTVSGGPMYYLSHGLAKKNLAGLGKVLAVSFSILCIGGTLGGGNMLQINQATSQFALITGGQNSFFYSNGWVFGSIIAIITGLIIIGGIRSIGKVTEKLVPFMCIVYFSTCLFIIFANITKLPEIFMLVIREAFNPVAVQGGIIGTIVIGLRRSVQSNEAGIGSAPIAYAAVQTKEPVSQGFISLLEPFIDTVIICSMTALVIIITGKYLDHSSLSGVELTSSAFASVFSFFPYILSLVIILFALSTLISWSYYGQKAWTYLVGEGKKRIIAYQMVFCLFIILGSSMNLKSVIDFTDAMMIGMAVPNILGMFILLPEVKKDLDLYWQKVKSKKNEVTDEIPETVLDI